MGLQLGNHQGNVIREVHHSYSSESSELLIASDRRLNKYGADIDQKK